MKSEEIRNSCYRIIDALWVADNIEKLPNCNNCKLKNSCGYVPDAGEMVRINCWGWKGEE